MRTALGGLTLTQSVEGRERYNVILRYDRPFRETPEDLYRILVPAPNGAHIPLGELAAIEFTQGPPVIRSENARLTGWVFIDIEGVDLGGYVSKLQETLAERISFPGGYTATVSGQYEQLELASKRLWVAVPATIVLILLMLLIHFGRLDQTMIVMLALPFGLIGGLWTVWLSGYHLSVAVAVGFIALAGIRGRNHRDYAAVSQCPVKCDQPKY